MQEGQAKQDFEWAQQYNFSPSLLPVLIGPQSSAWPGGEAAEVIRRLCTELTREFAKHQNGGQERITRFSQELIEKMIEQGDGECSHLSRNAYREAAELIRTQAVQETAGTQEVHQSLHELQELRELAKQVAGLEFSSRPAEHVLPEIIEQANSMLTRHDRV